MERPLNLSSAKATDGASTNFGSNPVNQDLKISLTGTPQKWRKVLSGSAITGLLTLYPTLGSRSVGRCVHFAD